MEKPCKKCGLTKALEAYYQDKGSKDGRRSSCIDCDKIRKRTPEVHAQILKYNNSDKGRAAAKKYVDSGKRALSMRGKYHSEARKRYRESGAQEAAQRKYNQSEKGKERERRVRNSPDRKAYVKLYKMRPKSRELMRRHGRDGTQRRLARSKGLAATLTVQQWQDAVRYFKFRCCYCNARMPLVQEHFIPLNLGGPYTRDNIVPACKHCNSSKHDTHPEKWCQPRVYSRVMKYFEYVITTYSRSGTF